MTGKRANIALKTRTYIKARPIYLAFTRRFVISMGMAKYVSKVCL